MREGYKKLIVWQNAKILRKKIFEITKRFPKKEFRRVIQINDATHSVKQKIQGGYRQSPGKYINVLKNVLQPSLFKPHGDIEDCLEDQLITNDEFHDLDALCGKTDYLLTRQIQGLERRLRVLKGLKNKSILMLDSPF